MKVTSSEFELSANVSYSAGQEWNKVVLRDGEHPPSSLVVSSMHFSMNFGERYTVEQGELKAVLGGGVTGGGVSASWAKDPVDLLGVFKISDSDITMRGEPPSLYI